MQWIYGTDWIHSFVSSAVTYLICALAPRKYAHILVFVWAMGYMTGSHLYRMYTSYMSGVFDFTGTQMVLTMKLTSFAYNLYDGTYDRKRVFDTYEDPRKARVYSSRKKFAIEALPNPLEFFGYIFCFTCILAGPAFEYKDYVRAIDGTVFKNKSNKSPPSSLIPGLKCLVLALICLGAHLYISAYFPLKMFYNDAFLEANRHNHLYRYGFTWVALFAERMKYYFAWKIAEGASIIGGFGFQGYDENDNVIGWANVENVEIIGFETASNLQSLTRAWNKRTQGWLERYTYSRTNNSLLITYFISALWHGLYPGFFVFFMTVPFLTNIERLWKLKINPLIIPGYDNRNYATAPQNIVTRLYWIVCTVMTTCTLNYCVQVFSLGSWENSMKALGSYHHVPHLTFLLLNILLTVIPGPKKEKKDKKEDKKTK